MPGRYARSTTAQRVAQLLGTREGRQHLTEFHWQQGMPVVMAAEHELLDDVMGLVSLHGQPVLVAMLQQSTDKLMFIHVSEPHMALGSVQEAKADRRIDSFFEEVHAKDCVTFRVKYWKNSAVAHAIPEFQQCRDSTRTSYHRSLMG